mgnify:CR=1 FL=1
MLVSYVKEFGRQRAKRLQPFALSCADGGAALNDALPDRLRGVAEPGEYHEALVALLLEQEQPRKSGVESGVESARRREDDERVEECLGE